jgi:hypothetical protein
MRPALSEEEIHSFYSMFLGLKPENGKVQVSKIKSFFGQSSDYEKIKT